MEAAGRQYNFMVAYDNRFVDHRVKKLDNIEQELGEKRQFC